VAHNARTRRLAAHPRHRGWVVHPGLFAYQALFGLASLLS